MAYASTEAASIHCEPRFGHAGPFLIAGLAVFKSVILALLSRSVSPNHISPRIYTTHIDSHIGSLGIESPLFLLVVIFHLYSSRLCEIHRLPGEVGFHSGDISRTNFQRLYLHGTDTHVFGHHHHHAACLLINHSFAHLPLHSEVALNRLVGSDAPLIVLIDAQCDDAVAREVDKSHYLARKHSIFSHLIVSDIHALYVHLFTQVDSHHAVSGIDSSRSRLPIDGQRQKFSLYHRKWYIIFQARRSQKRHHRTCQKNQYAIFQSHCRSYLYK